ncbi:MAG: T9SS type A sorting domain-containing protein [Bacteroidales bacterium]|nr:T9SS type A sorting domain-containing protein [Bacteroidales bacterium]
MKYLLLFVTLSFFTISNSFSQQWLKNLPQNNSKNELTFFDYQNAFYSYWDQYHVKDGYYYDNGEKKKARGWKQFKRWEYLMEKQVNPGTGEFPTTTAEEQVRLYYKSHPQAKSSNGNWTFMGPNTSDGGYAGIGRLNCIAYHPTDNNTYWVGAPSGGLWVTTNNGTSWTCLTNDNAVLGVSDIVIPSNFATSNTIYIATGDRDAWDNNSVGVLKSTDGGATWNTTGLSFSANSYRMVNRLMLDPANDNIIIAATNNGVYKTTNGGTNWSLLSSNNFIDMEYKPGSFNTLYGSTSSGDIFVSTNAGSSWTQALNLSEGERVELAVSANQPAWVYAVVAASDNGLYGIYKSTNSGSSFAQVFSGSTKNLLGWESDGSDAGGQGWYDLSIAASPTNASIVLVGGVNTWKSTNGGTSWAIANHWWGDGVPAAHADKHMLSYRSNGDLFECNDGGVYISTNNGTSWTDKTDGIVISQMYKLSVAKTNQNEVITGLQDNGTKLIATGTWYDVKGGDGMECLIDYTDLNIQYGTYVNGQIDRTTNHWGSATDISPNGEPNGAWVTPYIIHPTAPQTIFVGYENVYKSTNRGDSWSVISTMNTSDKIRSMAIAPSNPSVLYVADPSTIWKTTNGGTSWTTVTGTLPVSSASITYIAIKNDDPNTVWVTMSGYTNPGVYQTTNGGSSWTNISGGLPSIPVNTVVQNKLNTTAVELYCGTDYGVYYKSGSSNWTIFSNGLPNVIVNELEIWYGATSANSKLRAATYGRGLWESNLFSNSAMTYVSCTTTQDVTANVAQNSVNQQVIGIEIITNGDLSPLSATSFTFNTNGTTNPAGDVSNARLFYTGSVAAMSTSTQFGEAIVSPAGSFTITGTQLLGSGINYFWLAYDITADAAIGNYIDAECTSLTITDVKTPTVTSPTGNRRISVVYCDAGSPDVSYEYISGATIGNINNSSARGANGYEDFTGLVTSVIPGYEVPFSISVTNPYETDQILIWVDWNKDSDFEDAGENVYASNGVSFTSPHSGSFTVPTSATPGATRLRVRLNDAGNGSNSDPCGDSGYGEVEDYTINVSQQLNTSIIGTTRYDLQSNASVAPRLFKRADGTMSATWTFGMLETSFTDRGTGYNYFNGTTWGAEPTARLESVRTGWPVNGIMSTGKEFVMSHGTNKWNYIYRAAAGTGNWSAISIPTSALTAVSWPRTAVSGNTIHCIALDGNSSSTTYLHLYYWRSSNGGISWDKTDINLDPAGYSTTGVTGDGYAIDASGNTVAIVVFGQFMDVTLFKSTDNGNTFTKTRIMDFPVENFSLSTSALIDYDANGTGDYINTSDASGAVVIDNNGLVHAFFGKMQILDPTAGDGYYTYFPTTDGIMYWNENMGAGTFSGTVNGTDYIDLFDGVSSKAVQIASMTDEDGDGSIILQDAGSGFPFGMYYRSLSSFPSAGVDANNYLYVSYASVNETLYKTDATPNIQHFRNIYMIKSVDGGSVWGPAYNCSEESFSGMENMYACIARNVGDNVQMIWQYDDEPGISLQGDNDAYRTNYIGYTEVPTSLIPAAPLAITLPATAIGSETATLNGSVNAFEIPTTVSFEYGTSTSYSASVIAVPETVNVNGAENVSAAITGLLPNTTYHFRVKAENENGTAYGQDLTFTTITQYEVITSVSPSGSGNTTGAGFYDDGENVVVMATANSGYSFVNWTENTSVVSVNPNYSFNISSDRNLVANFSVASYTITVAAAPEEGGEVSGGGTYFHNENATVTATANQGYTFVNWTDNGEEVSTDANYSFTVTSARNLVANFEADVYEITVTLNPLEGGIVNGAGTYSLNTIATLEATPNTGFAFVNWTEDNQEVSQDYSYSFTVTSDRVLTANFEALEQFDLTIAVDGTGGTTDPVPGIYQHYSGDIINISAIANPDYIFAKWVVNSEELFDETIQVTVTGATTATAYFIYDVGIGSNNASLCRIYPNPSAGLFTMETIFGNGTEYSVTIRDITDRIVYHETLKTRVSTYNLSGFAAGVYVIEIENAGQRAVAKVVIKESRY